MSNELTTQTNRRTISYQRHRQKMRKEVYTRDNFQCQDCGKQFEIPARYSGIRSIAGLTLGHVIPRCLGGKFDLINLRAQCEPCNDKMGNQIWFSEVRRYRTNYTLRHVFLRRSSE